MPERQGRKHEKLEPQERLFVSMRISTEPYFCFVGLYTAPSYCPLFSRTRMLIEYPAVIQERWVQASFPGNGLNRIFILSRMESS
jgi:hypothetical protein